MGRVEAIWAVLGGGIGGWGEKRVRIKEQIRKWVIEEGEDIPEHYCC